MRPGPSRDSPIAFVSAADKSNRYRYRISSHGSGVDHLAICSVSCGPASRRPLSVAPGLSPHPFLDSSILFEFGVSMDQPRCPPRRGCSEPRTAAPRFYQIAFGIMYGEATSSVGKPPDLEGKPASPKNPAPGSPPTASASPREARTRNSSSATTPTSPPPSNNASAPRPTSSKPP